MTTRDPNTITDDSYFYAYQNVLEGKQLTLTSINKLNQKFVIRDYFQYAWFNHKWHKIEKTKREILMNLSNKNSRINYQGEDYSVAEILRINLQLDLDETHKQNFDRPFVAYLEGQIGYLTSDQIIALEDLHRKINEDLHELYGSMEYKKMTGG